MRRSARKVGRALAAALLMLITIAAPPALAKGRATGSAFEITVTGFAERVYLGDSLNGTLGIVLSESGTAKARHATVQGYVETPMGRALLSSHTVSVPPSEMCVVELRYPIAEDAPTGRFTFGVQVMLGNETLSVEHEVYIVGGK